MQVQGTLWSYTASSGATAHSFRVRQNRAHRLNICSHPKNLDARLGRRSEPRILSLAAENDERHRSPRAALRGLPLKLPGGEPSGCILAQSLLGGGPYCQTCLYPAHMTAHGIDFGRGSFRIRTATGSLYLLDLSAGSLTRFVAAVEPAVDHRTDDPDVPTLRTTSRVVAITTLGEDEEGEQQ